MHSAPHNKKEGRAISPLLVIFQQLFLIEFFADFFHYLVHSCFLPLYKLICRVRNDEEYLECKSSARCLFVCNIPNDLTDLILCDSRFLKCLGRVDASGQD